MEVKYFKNRLRGYNMVLAILKANSEDDFCRSCIGLEGAITKGEKGLKKLKLDLGNLVVQEDEKKVLTNQIDQLSQKFSSLPLGEEPT